MQNDAFLESHFRKSLHEKCLYSEFFWSIFSPNAGKHGPEKLHIQTLLTQGIFQKYINQLISFNLFETFGNIWISELQISLNAK